MKLARFWTRQSAAATSPDGNPVHATSRGWSNESKEAAAAMARDIAAKVAHRIAAGDRNANRYPYGDRPLPEPVIQEFRDANGEQCGVITRNVYGALVLNARDLMFIDIDRADSPNAPDAIANVANELVAGISSLFGQPKPQPPVPVSSGVVADIQRVAQRHNLSLRIYKTAAGYRALVFNRRFDPASAETESLLREFGSDPLYIRLCKMQESFRARLTPKPWRLNLPQPPVSFPFEAPTDEARFYEWVGKYTTASGSRATCSFVAGYGTGPIDPALQPLIAYHDQETKVGSALPLA